MGFQKGELICCIWLEEYSGILRFESMQMATFLKQE